MKTFAARTPRGRTVTICAIALAVATLAPSAGRYVGFHPSFLPAFFAAMLIADLMTAYLLWQQYLATGNLRLLGFSGTYLFSAMLVIPHALTLTYVMGGPGPLQATPGAANWFWAAWHLAIPIGFGLSVLRWPERVVDRVENYRRRTSRRVVGALGALTVVLTVVFTRFHEDLPFLGGRLNYTRMAHTLGPIVVAVGIVFLAIVWRRVDHSEPIQRWIAVAAAATLADSVLTILGESRFTLGWYSGRLLAIITTATVLGALAGQVSRIFRETSDSNAELREQNDRDMLTGVYSRRALLARAEALMGAPEDLAVAMIDLDHFKSVNDTHGHLAGDQVLKQAAEVMSSCLRGGDVLGRIGGEEFVVLLAGADSKAAPAAGERIRAAIAEHSFAIDEGTLTVTASIGVAHRLPTDTIIESLLGRADVALYEAKAQGRDRVRSANVVSIANGG